MSTSISTQAVNEPMGQAGPVHDPVNILMVDDQPGKLLSYEAILSDLGENLVKATSAKDALEKLLKMDVSIVLMDVSMPDIDGFELAEIIRQHPRFQKTAILFISAVHLSDLDRLKGYQHGAVDYLSVPVVPEVLRAKVKVFAELHRKNQQLERLNTELEKRVAERTQELQDKAVALEKLNTVMAQKNQELDAIVQTAPDIIFSRNPDGGREYISGRFYEYTGAPLDSAIGYGWLDYVHPDDKEESLSRWLHCVESGAHYECEYRLRGADSQYRWFRARAVPLRDGQGRILKWYGTCSDIHDSKVLEQSIRENAIELERMVESRTAALRRLSNRMMTLQDEERRRIAREIHDGLGQELAASKMILDGILAKDKSPSMHQAAVEASQLVDRAIQQVRTISHLLHPPLLDEVGLVSALRWFLEGLSDRSGIKVHLEVDPAELPRLRSELETAVFRIIQEALTNMFRHSGARNGFVSLAEKDGSIRVTVRDDGKGIEEQVMQQRPESVGVGIGGMRQRVTELGGTLRLANANPGTIVEVVIPAVRREQLGMPVPA
ncbi:MAG TPA: PAS domain-containing protein [Candidatus Sulfotelmatobacter sp.]|nr:PAS domain-containing protein [Candidatus Sulfotelmatobacter sp.]